MRRDIMWSPWETPGLEHVQIVTHSQGVVADGVIVGVQNQQPFRVRYVMHCDQHWQVHAVHLTLLSGSGPSLHLLTDGAGSWTTDSKKALPSLNGCIDIDISGTPFTNTLPIRRLALSVGSSAMLSMVYILVPDLQVERNEQRYTCVETTASGGRYQFESLEQGVVTFAAELLVDHDGLVVEYPELFRRVAAW